MTKEKIVVAYSGGLDTSVMVKWLAENYNAEIITYTALLGQEIDCDALQSKAWQTGASQVIIDDLTAEFICGYIWPSLKAGALYEGKYPLATALGRPLIAKKLVEIAQQQGAKTIAHGCTGKGNDQVRLELAIQSLDPSMQVLAPLRNWEFKSREEEIEYAIQHAIPITSYLAPLYSVDENIWGVSVECGELEDPSLEPPVDAFQKTASITQSPDDSDFIQIDFHNGIPICLNNSITDPIELIASLNEIGAAHGIGRIDMIENRVVGIKSREIYESPAAVILHKFHAELESLILDKQTIRYKKSVADQLANLIYDGFWFAPLTQSLFTFVESTQQNLSGSVKAKLFKGNIIITSRTSEFSIYQEKLATYSADDQFDHAAAAGFIQLYGLEQKVIAQTKLKHKLEEKADVMGE